MGRYQLLDSGNFMRLEQVGPYRIARPAAAAVWQPTLSDDKWRAADATFHRIEQKAGQARGEWSYRSSAIQSQLQNSWEIQFDDIRLLLKLTSFGHIGLFAEQEKNWGEIKRVISRQKETTPGEPIRILNLFAYTGAATLFAAMAGAEVVHLDASKGTVKWARDNAETSKLADRPIRWIVDDAKSFVKKELRRGSRYHGILLDPPTYGRGADGEVWKIEDHLLPLLNDCVQLFEKNFSFFLLSSHSPGYTPIALKNIMQQSLGSRGNDGRYEAAEMVITDSTGKPLPSGADCLFTRAII